jgi:adenylosuccinate synthase
VSVTVVVGAQWGDEGKGKITDFLAADVAVVARAQGGSNAGHTVVFDGQEYKLHLLPSGILRSDVLAIAGAGMVIDPEQLLHELEQLPVERGELLLDER